MDARRRRLALLASFGGLLVAGFVYAFVLPQTPARMTKPASELIGAHPLWAFVGSLPLPIPRSPGAVAATVLATGALAFGSYAVAAWASWRWPGRARPVRAAVLGGIALLAVSAAAMPNRTTDIYNYILRGRVAAEYGDNPYYTVADRFSEDPVYPYAEQRYTSEAGGKPPVWMALNVSLARVAGDDVVDSLVLYRLVLFGLAAGSVVLVLWILGRMDPRHAMAGVVLFGWSPVVTVYGPAKTDTLMVFLLLAGVAALTVGRKRRAAVALALSGFVKLITLPLAAAFGLRELRRRNWRDLAWIVAIFAATAAAVYLPFSRDLGVLLGHAETAGSAAARDVLTLRPLWIAGFVGLVGWVGLSRDEGLPHLLRGWALIALYFSALLMPIALAWYQMTLIAVVALVRDWRLAAAMGALSLSSFGLTTWRAAESASFPLPLGLPVPGHAAYLLPLAVLAAVGAAVWYRYRGRSVAGTVE